MRSLITGMNESEAGLGRSRKRLEVQGVTVGVQCLTARARQLEQSVSYDGGSSLDGGTRDKPIA